MRKLLLFPLLAIGLFAQSATVTISKGGLTGATSPTPGPVGIVGEIGPSGVSFATSKDIAELTAQVKALQAQVDSLRAQVAAIRITSVGVPAAPYEAAAVSLIQLATTVIDSQPPDVRTELWRMYLEDMRRWQAFWAALRGGLGDALKESAK